MATYLIPWVRHGPERRDNPWFREREIAAAAVVIIGIILVAAAAGTYVLLNGGSGSAQSSETTPCATETKITSGSITTTSTIVCGLNSTSSTSGQEPSSQSSTSSSSPSRSSSTASSSSYSSSTTNTSMLETFRVHFNWSDVEPVGNITTTQTGSGTFLLTIDLNFGVGSANGTGHVDEEITGICAGHTSTDYTFRVFGMLDPVSGNLSLSATQPSPSTSDYPVACTRPLSDYTATASWPAFYPMSASLPARYGASIEGNYGPLMYQLMLA